MTTESLPPIDRLIKRAQLTVSRVTFDDSGIAGKGGNGGLLSSETIRASDELRLALAEAPRITAAITEVLAAWPDVRKILDEYGIALRPFDGMQSDDTAACRLDRAIKDLGLVASPPPD